MYRLSLSTDWGAAMSTVRSAEVDSDLAISVISPTKNYVHLSKDGVAKTIPGGEQFWSLSTQQLDAYGYGWLVAEFVFEKDWANWEMHPEGDELVYVLSGEAQFLMECAQGVQIIHAVAPAMIRVPCGVWHTAKIIQAGRFLHMTMGAGTQSRPV